MKRNYKMSISYDGTRYYGWEHQPDTELTIQGKIEMVLAKMTGLVPLEAKEGAEPIQKIYDRLDDNKKINVIAAGRTDAGVHAKAMIANVHLDTDMDEKDIQKYMNRYLPDDICINELKACSDRFHARYNALAKTYCYTLYAGESKPVFDRKYVTVLDEKPDVEAMKKAAEVLEGTHDFKSFCANPRMKKSTVRMVDSITFKCSGPYIRIYFHGNGFLQNMVRILTGTLLEVGFGRMTPSDVEKIMEAKDRKLAGPTAKPCGLSLMEVEY